MNSKFYHKTITEYHLHLPLLLFFMCLGTFSYAQPFVHPGILHKLSDLERMKYMVDAQKQPYYDSYLALAADGKSSYGYVVRGDNTMIEIKREPSPSINRYEMESDCRAAYSNALMWFFTKDSRHAEKAIEIFKAWKNLKKFTGSATPLAAGLYGYLLVNAAEIIKHTYGGWSSSDQADFKTMLLYQSGSDKSFKASVNYFAPLTWGNQEIIAQNTMMAIAIYTDDSALYARALRYFKNQAPLSDPLPGGPPTRTDLYESTPYMDRYNRTIPSTYPIPENYLMNGPLVNYIRSSGTARGQCVESARDQDHAQLGLGALATVAEMAYNQGDNLYGESNNLLLAGFEYTTRYNLVTLNWNPPFTALWDRQGLNYLKAVSPDGRASYEKRPVYEMVAAHYKVRAKLASSAYTYTNITIDSAKKKISSYEKSGNATDQPGWGGLTYHREADFVGEPCNSALTKFEIHKLPGTIEAEDFDYSPLAGEGLTYHDSTTGNSGSSYRTSEDVDVQTCTDGGYNVGWTVTGEWLTYTIHVPETKNYEITIRYAASVSTSKIRLEFDGVDKTGNVSLASTGGNQVWADKKITNVSLTAGAYILKVAVAASGFNLNNITIAENPIGKTVWLKASSGKYVQADDNDPNDALWANSTSVGNWQKFLVVDAGSGLIALKAYNNKYVSSGNGTYSMKANKTTIDAECKFKWFEEGDGWISLKNGNYHVSSENGSTAMRCDVPTVGSWEKFNWDATTSSGLTANTITRVNLEPGLADDIVSLFPNPVSDILNVKLSNAFNDKATLNIYNAMGQLMQSFKVSNNSTLNLSNLTPGIYTVKILGDKETTHKKIIKN
ncbi:carbohydrate-binding protein [Pedobacter frigiditerrae]|uniref:Carbohydrate-binding protein n=1 Tax=Pedobacter frigiditerrae TaxID=2530452 RepID=A0A4R0MPM8_9SPHI|nr:carbohydrate-binding protein [Pedobacter frigiditerrae]TCC88603.1 carbohydrate-binding protein [Pedobacter frigiditerrae]